jgi:thioredoxin-dependent peroxiredoxin
MNAMKLLVLGLVAGPLLSYLTSASAATAINLKTGDPAPKFEGVDQDGKPWKLADYVGKKLVLVYFYPKDDTPGCTAEACGLRDRMGDLNKDQVVVVGVSFDTYESHQKFIAKYHLNFPLLADTEGKIADLFGARRGSDAKMAKRVSFLIGLDGKLAHITDNSAAAVHLEEMQAAIARLKKAN